MQSAAMRLDRFQRNSTAQGAVVLKFPAPPPAITIAAIRHNRDRRLRLHLHKCPMPISPMNVYFVTGLGTRVSEIWWRLAIRFWVDGPIADDPIILARAAGMTPKRWAKFAPTLGAMFQRDEDGAWTDHVLAAARDEFVTRFLEAEAGFEAAGGAASRG